jgi:OOP family OmpA-OmpF porin
MTDLVAMVRGALAGDLEAPASAMLGVEPATLQQGLGAVAPVLLAGAVKLFEGGGAQQLLALAQGAIAGGNPLDRLPALVGDADAGAGWLEQGGAIAAALMGDRAPALETGLASLLAVQPGTVRQMAALAAPLLMGALAKAGGGTPTAEGLGGLMAAARALLPGQLPAGVAGLLDPSLAPPPGADPPAAVPAKAEGAKWLPWVVAAAVAVAALFGLRRCDAERPAAEEGAPAAMVADPLDQTVELPRGIIIVVRQGSAVDAARRYLATAEPPGRRFVIDNLVFDEASNQLTGESQQTIDGIAGAMKAWPETRIRLIGFTDDTGDAMANVALSQARAEAVKRALIESGVEAERIEVEGRGEAEPIAPNDTEEGRAQNRRVELEVTAK